MPEADLFLLLVRPLSRAGMRYIIGGSLAATFYGEPRLTHDVYFVVFLNSNDIQQLTGFKADFYPAGRDDLNAWGFRFKREIQFEDETVTLAPPEYVIVRKLEYFREGGSEKHLRDIRSMLAVSREQIDVAQLNEWLRRLGLEAEWQRVSP